MVGSTLVHMTSPATGFWPGGIPWCGACLELNKKVSSLQWLQLYILGPSLLKMYTFSKFVFPISFVNSTCQLLSHPVCAMVLNWPEILTSETFSSFKVPCPLTSLVPSCRFKSVVFKRTLTQQPSSLWLGLPQLGGTHPGAWIGTTLGTSLLVIPGTLLWSSVLLCKPGFCPPWAMGCFCVMVDFLILFVLLCESTGSTATSHNSFSHVSSAPCVPFPVPFQKVQGKWSTLSLAERNKYSINKG